MDGDKRIIKLTNKLLETITAQGYCVRSQGDFGHVNIYIHGIGTYNEVTINNITNTKQNWEVKGKLTTTLIPEKEMEEIET